MNTAGLSAALLIHLKDFSSFRRLKGVRAVAEGDIKRNAEVEADGIHVKVQGDVVILEGRVHFWRQRHVAERSGW
ncbi:MULTISPECIES: hypothetical protein [unclassified Pseudomonas]|uniref:hypothetical protein n=1 Tax=unclassified Pseudomonas TaxID=196821 RepID=UPI0005D435B2|nr:hypothetical protein [Pseudomonas sp. ES3-33]KJH77776.1 hypothetical protein UB23_06095 [Pseudomonas sp. ES3-33]